MTFATTYRLQLRLADEKEQVQLDKGMTLGKFDHLKPQNRQENPIISHERCRSEVPKKSKQGYSKKKAY